MASATERFHVRNRWTKAVQFTAEITCAPDAPIGIKLGLAVLWGHRSGAVLSDTDLSGVVLSGADLRRAVLRRAVLRRADLSDAVLSDAVLSDTDLSGVVLSGADLRRAVLRRAVLRRADLSDAVLSGADLRRADLSDAPKIENIHQKVYAAASAPGALDMGDWHSCETRHSWAGWVTVLAGEEGRALEERIGTPAAATLIYLASDTTIGRFPNFYCDDAEALEDMRLMAEAEAAKVSA